MSSEEQKKQLLAQKLFRNLKSKKTSLNSTSGSSNSKLTLSTKKPRISQVKSDETDLTKRAIDEINRETERAAKLANEIGPSGWRMQPKRTNKRFLANTMRSVLSHNERTSVKYETKSKRKYENLTKRPPKFGARLHSFQSSEERMTKREKSKPKT